MKYQSITSTDRNTFLNFFVQAVNEFENEADVDLTAILNRQLLLKLPKISVGFRNKRKIKMSQFQELLENIKSDENFINEIDLHQCQISNNKLQLLSKTMGYHMQSLISINLSSNLIDDSGIKILCDGLWGNAILKSLILIDVQCKTEGCRYLSILLPTLPSLQLFDLSYNPIGDFGVGYLCETIVYLSNIQSLHLVHCSFYEGGLSYIFHLLENHPLKLLNIQSNIIPPTFLGLLKKSLSKNKFLMPLQLLYDNHIMDDHEITRLLSLQTLSHQQRTNLRGYKMIAENIQHQYDKVLNFSFCSVKTFKLLPKFQPFSIISELYLNNNQIRTFPLTICELVSLKVLSLVANQLCSIPNEINKLKNLEEVYISMNNFQNIDFVKQLPLLKIIDARWNRIEEISNFNENRNLETILLDGNSIIRVPFQKILFNLKRLKLFSIFKNACINYFSAIIYRFSTLDVRILDLSRCNIQFIPQEISLLPFLFELNVCSLSHFCYLFTTISFVHLFYFLFFIFYFLFFIFLFLFFISYF